MTDSTPLDRKLVDAAERLCRAFRAARQHLATRHRLSLLQLLILEQLADHKPRRAGELAAELAVSQPTMSDAIATLERKGLAHRQPDPDDRRATTVSLSPDGVALAGEISQELVPLLGGDETAADPDDRGTALRVLLAEVGRLHRAGVIAVDRGCATCDDYHPPHAGTPAHCDLVAQRLSDQDLRVDCPEHSSIR
ncbi:MAG: MarR family winged helix-turn-helix transcriptional regulator [Gaiellales bacterium]